MGTAWFTAADLREVTGARQAADQEKYDDAAEIAMGKVTEECGPIPFATITDEVVEAAGSPEACLDYRATRGLVSVATYPDGVTLDVADWVVDGQVLRRKAGGSVGRVKVTYLTGYFDDTIEGAKAPAWARGMAKLIGHQHVRLSKRFRISDSDDDLSGTGYLVPAAAREVARDYLLHRKVHF